MLPSPSLRHVADFDIDLSPIEEMGDGRGGKRRIIPIVGDGSVARRSAAKS